MTVFVDENIPYVADIIGEEYEVKSFNGRLLSREGLIAGDCEALITRSTTKVNKDLLHGTKVRFVGSATSGIDHVDVGYLDISDIHFVYAPGANANSVAELVVYSWIKWAKLLDTGLIGKKLGIIGYGNIGKAVAKYAHYFGLEVFLNDPPLEERGFEFPIKCVYAELDEIFEKCDIITNHVPLTKAGPHPTYGLINDNRIDTIRRDALFIHASRGGVVSERTLLKKLVGKELYAVIDVWENEPDFNSELAFQTIHCSPHVAGYSRDGKLKGSLKMLIEFGKFFKIKLAITDIISELRTYSRVSPKEYKNFNFIFDRLEKRRKFSEDTKQFLEAAKLEAPMKLMHFDKLRRNYPSRWESL